MLFCDRLFTLDPSLRILFRGDTKEQGKKLRDALAVLNPSLDRFQDLRPSLQTMESALVMVFGLSIMQPSARPCSKLWQSSPARPLSDIDTETVQAFINQKIAAGYSHNMLKNLKWVLSAVFEEAREVQVPQDQPGPAGGSSAGRHQGGTTQMVEMRGPINAAQQRLGHTRPDILLKHYAHVLDESAEFAAETLSSAISSGEKAKEKTVKPAVRKTSPSIGSQTAASNRRWIM